MTRPREFDERTVLDQAMEVFWRHGYEGASMTALSKAMGLNAPSIYGAFGSKKGLFQAVLNRYGERRIQFAHWTVAGKTSREVAERMLFGAIEWLTAADEPLGCLLIQGGLSAGVGNQDMPAALSASQSQLEVVLAERFQAAVADGDLAPGTDVLELAQYLHMVFCGLAVLAARGAPPEQLRTAATRALIGWG